jgi:hypothetical protein
MGQFSLKVSPFYDTHQFSSDNRWVWFGLKASARCDTRQFRGENRPENPDQFSPHF